MENTPLFSCVLIVRNEAKTLPRLIASLKNFQDRGGEIIVVDTGSTDDTAAIATSLGCAVDLAGTRFLETINATTAQIANERFVVDGEEPVVKAGETLFDYTSARNYAASLASNNMIMMPDADEIWTSLDIDAINNYIKEGVDQFEYNFIFAHDEHEKPLVQFLHSKFYNRTKMQWKGIIHEVLNGSGRRQLLPESIAKLEHYQNVETNRSGYLKGLALDCYLHPESDRNSHYFAREMLYNGRYKSAIKEFERHIAMGKWPIERAQSMLFIGECYMMLGDKDEAIKWYMKSFDLEPNRREPLMKLAELAYRENSPIKAIVYCKAALELNGVNFYANYQPYYAHLPHEILYWAYYWAGNKEEAKKHYDIAVSFCPDNEKYRVDRCFFYRSNPLRGMVNPDLPIVSIIIPHIDGTRKNGLKKCVNSIKKAYAGQTIHHLELGGETVPQKVQRVIEAGDLGEYICYAADDMYFEPGSIEIAIRESIELHKGLVSFNEGPLLPDNGNICTHFIIRRDLIDKMGGEIFSAEFNHVGCDNLLWAKCDKLGEAYHSERAKIVHNHFSKTGKPMDEIYKKGWANVETDREKLTNLLAQI